MEVQIHHPVRFEQDVQFLAVHEAELRQPGVLELLEAFAQRYRIAIKRVDGDGTLSALQLAAAPAPRVDLDVARRQQEQRNMAKVTSNRQRKRLMSTVADVPSHWSMVKPGIRHVDVTANRWKDLTMCEHFQRLVNSSIDQVKP